MLRDWDIERFFSSDRAKKNSPNSQTPNSIAMQSNNDASKPKFTANLSADRNKSESSGQMAKPIQSSINTTATNNNNNNPIVKPKNNFLSNLLENAKNHKRQESDSKLSSNFIRGFRREHSDFFPSTKRHSVVLGERQSAIAHFAPHRSSAIYTKHNKNNNGEPILTDFVSRTYLDGSPSSSISTKKSTTTTTTTTNTKTSTPITTSASSNAIANNKCTDNNVNNNRNLFFMGPRREKTESVISLRNSANRNLLFDQLQVKEKPFSQKNQPKKNLLTKQHQKSQCSELRANHFFLFLNNRKFIFSSFFVLFYVLHLKKKPMK